jgi:hypothetical protein
MILSGVILMGSNVLKYMRDISLSVPRLLGGCGTQGTVEEEGLRTLISHQAAPLQVKISLEVE